MPSIHAAISPSASHRWMECPPSAQLNRKFVERFGEKSSPAAKEGTQAHSLCELKLRKELGEINDFLYEKEVAALGEFPPYAERNTDIYVDVVLEKYYTAKKTCPDTMLFIEQQLDMSRWIPECFGTSDAVIVSDDLLEIIDYKNGQGVPVDALENSQMRIYALGAYNEFQGIFSFKNVRETIVQPRINNISEETLTLEELLAWGEALRPVAELAYKGQGEFKAGDHCRFCNVKPFCKTRVEKMFALAQSGFDAPEVLSDEALANMLPYLDTVSAWIKDVKDYAQNQALNGVTFKGFKLVRGRRPGREWKNEASVIAQLKEAGYSEAQYLTEPALKSVNELEKELHKSTFSALLGDLVKQGEGAPTLVPESDTRETYVPAGMAFEDLES